MASKAQDWKGEAVDKEWQKNGMTRKAIGTMSESFGVEPSKKKNGLNSSKEALVARRQHQARILSRTKDSLL